MSFTFGQLVRFRSCSTEPPLLGVIAGSRPMYTTSGRLEAGCVVEFDSGLGACRQCGAEQPEGCRKLVVPVGEGARFWLEHPKPLRRAGVTPQHTLWLPDVPHPAGLDIGCQVRGRPVPVEVGVEFPPAYKVFGQQHPDSPLVDDDFVRLAGHCTGSLDTAAEMALRSLERAGMATLSHIPASLIEPR